MEKLLLSRNETRDLLKIGFDKLDEIVSVGILSKRLSGNMWLFSMKEIQGFIDKLYSPDFPMNFKNEKQRLLMIEYFMSPKEAANILEDEKKLKKMVG